MKILVTGHMGFIGSNLLPLLKDKGHQVLGLDWKSGQDLKDSPLPDVDLVIHLAGIGGVRESFENPNEYWFVNVEGTRRLLQHYSSTRVLVASSSSQYEPHLNPYAASKHVLESIPHDNVCFMRFHTVYGPEPRSKMFFDKLINDTLEYVTTHTRDFIHVSDLIQAIDILIHDEYTGPIDIGTGRWVRISDIRKDLPVRHDTVGERTDTIANTLEMSRLGFKPKYNVKMFLDEHNIGNDLYDECL